MKIVFMGTPDFAVPCLDALLKADYEVAAVFSQPDKPKGRGYQLMPTPVKQLALQHGIPCCQPGSLKTGEDAEYAHKLLTELAPDLIVVVAYGRILPKAVLDVPRYGCINVHASLLPKYRGAGPIQWSVLNGESETGVTTMYMAPGIDTGDMILRAQTPIGENETASELHDRLSVLGAELLVRTVRAIEAGNAPREPQDDTQATYAPMLSKELSAIDFNKPAREVHNLIRGLSTWPCACATLCDSAASGTAALGGKRLKLYRSELVEGNYSAFAPGTIVKADNFTVACGDGNAIRVTELQEDCCKRMKTSDYLRGNKLAQGARLLKVHME